MNTINITVAYDEEVLVWYVKDSNVRGLAAEATTMTALFLKLAIRVPEMMNENKG